ncbi:hypothetical protein ABL78_3076 [Leptomonas seymouri]|uniref:Uncharacterized protein n=1 Tax=Leptomonas seymouri TaxID=5684 RepID=A0A0N0P6P3_LEPSE|nr:hypothetical protein ABL78_3076 [Leptomonas seymouri]|eukprot:KPI87849.1 hypothetical protein ABL78_3076 [Leptomonas seymouri]
MSARNSGVLRAARAVANGEGDWAEVAPAVRDAIVLAITQSSVAPLRSLEGTLEGIGPCASTTAAVMTSAPLGSWSSDAPGVLTEGNVQSSIQTFEDAAWVRDEAVRSYAEFHNSVESLHAAMRTQLYPVWKTALQLRPGILADVRDHLKLSRTSMIPDGVPIMPAAAQHIAQQERILDEVEDTLQMLRNTSVRFAAHFLSDEEKISMGANPAYLRAPDIDREVVESRAQGLAAPPAVLAALATPSADDNAPHRSTGHDLAYSNQEEGLVNSATSREACRECNAASDSASQERDARSHSHHHHRIDHDSHERRRPSLTSGVAAPTSDPLLEELRKQYQQRVKDLEGNHRRTSPVVQQGVWPQVGSVTSSHASRRNSTHSKKERRSSASQHVDTSA